MDILQFSQNGRFLMLALDQRGSFRKILNPVSPDAVTDEEIIQVKSEIINALQDQFSGILIDPVWGLPAFQQTSKVFPADVTSASSTSEVKGKPYLLCIEKSGFEEQEGERITELAYTVPQLKNLGALGIKLNLNFNPYSLHLENQIGMVKKVFDDCRQEQLPFFLEIVTYPFKKYTDKPELILKAVEIFLQKQIIPDVFKLEFPGNADACKKITDILGKIPWILLTLGIPYEIFKKHLQIACFNGASGFLAGRSIWQEVGQHRSEAERKKFLQEVAASRFREISNIVRRNTFLT